MRAATTNTLHIARSETFFSWTDCHCAAAKIPRLPAGAVGPPATVVLTLSPLLHSFRISLRYSRFFPVAAAGASAKDVEPITEALGEYVARAYASKNWQLRDQALQYIDQQLAGGLSKNKDFCKCAPWPLQFPRCCCALL